jgi:hypothetical protein
MASASAVSATALGYDEMKLSDGTIVKTTPELNFTPQIDR